MISYFLPFLFCFMHLAPAVQSLDNVANNPVQIVQIYLCVPHMEAVFVFVLFFAFVFSSAIHGRQGLNNVASNRSSAVHKSFLDRSRKVFGQPKLHTIR